MLKILYDLEYNFMKEKYHIRKLHLLHTGTNLNKDRFGFYLGFNYTNFNLMLKFYAEVHLICIKDLCSIHILVQ